MAGEIAPRLKRLRSIPVSFLPSGVCVGIAQAQTTAVFTTSSTSYVDWTGMSVSLTTASALSKFEISLTSGVSSDSSNNYQYISLFFSTDGGSTWTQIAMGDAAGSATRCWVDGAWATIVNSDIVLKPIAATYVHFPGLNAGVSLKYKLQIIRPVGGTAYFGRTKDTSTTGRSAIPSVLIVREYKI